MRVIPLLLAAGVITYPAKADDWAAARLTNVFSQNAQHFVQIIPGESLGDTFGFAGAKRGRYAHALFYKRQKDRSYQLEADIVLQNPIAPVDAMVANSGHLITFDNWHNAGYGKVVAIYDPRGTRIRAWTLEQLYDSERIARIPTSVSSRWWRCRPIAFADPTTQSEVFVMEQLGGAFVFDLGRGTFKYNPGKATCER